MLNPVTRVKDTVQRHKSRILFGAGVVVGVTGMVMVRKTIPIHLTVPIDHDTLQHLIDHTEDSASFVNRRPLAVLELFNSVNLEQV